MTPVDRELLLAEAKATHRRVGRTFWLASRMLPRERRDDVHLLYLVLRTLDDAVDHGDPDASELVGRVEAWAAGGAPRGTEAMLLADIDDRAPLPRDAVRDFCAGMRDDLRRRAFDTEAEVDEYCYRVAGTVGLLMTALLGTDRPDAARGPAIALGQAMQRTNILRDLDEDAAAGRCFVARETIERFGPPLPGRRAALMRDQIARADAAYAVGVGGIDHLRTGRRAVAAAAAMYREILRELEAADRRAHPERAVVPLHRKLAAAARAQRHIGAARRPHAA